MHKCEFFLEIDGAVALQFSAGDLCGFTSKGLLHPFVPPFNEIAGPKDDWYGADGWHTMGTTEQSSRNHFPGLQAAGCISLWFFKAVFAYTSCGMTTNTLAQDRWALTT